MSNLGEVGFLRENVAVALDYGYYKAQRGEFPESGTTVLFCDVGAYCSTLSVVRYTNVLFLSILHHSLE
jgi:molecular chaperone DnaK (HSP70)